jgi:hypothetical protein
MKFHDLFAIAYPLLCESPPPVPNDEVEVGFDLNLLWSDAPDGLLEALDEAAVRWHLVRCPIPEAAAQYTTEADDEGNWVGLFDEEGACVASFTAHEESSRAKGGGGKPMIVWF